MQAVFKSDVGRNEHDKSINRRKIITKVKVERLQLIARSESRVLHQMVTG